MQDNTHQVLSSSLIKYWLIGFLCWGILMPMAKGQDLAEAPQELPEVNFDWQEALTNMSDAKYIKAFLSDPNYESSEYLGYFSARKTALVSILQTPSLQAIFYDWLQPRIQANLKQLSYYELACLRKTLLHCETYLKEVSLEEEQAYEQEIKQQKVKSVSPNFQHLQFHRNVMGGRFVRWDPKRDYYDTARFYPKPESSASPYRRLEAFLYRRLAYDKVERKSLQYFVQRLLKDCVLPEDGTVSSPTNDRILAEIVTLKNGQLNGKIYRKVANYYTTETQGQYKANQKVGKWRIKKYRGNGQSLAYEIEETYKKGALIERKYVMYSNDKPFYSIWYHILRKRYEEKHVNRVTKKFETKRKGRFFEAFEKPEPVKDFEDDEDVWSY